MSHPWDPGMGTQLWSRDSPLMGPRPHQCLERLKALQSIVPAYIHIVNGVDLTARVKGALFLPLTQSPATSCCPCTMEPLCRFLKLFRLDSGYTQPLSLSCFLLRCLMLSPGLLWLPVVTFSPGVFSPDLSNPGIKFLSQVHPDVGWEKFTDQIETIPPPPCSVEETMECHMHMLC